MSTLKAKIYRVSILGRAMLVYGLTRQSAITNALDHLDSEIDARIATGEEVFAAARSSTDAIVGEAKYKRVVDPEQSDLPIAAVAP